MATKVIMPEMGEGVVEGTVSRWLKQEGDRIEQYEPILEIETDKVTTEATAEVAGTLLEILVPEGETVETGTVLAYIGTPDEAAGDGPARSRQQAAGSRQPEETPPAGGRRPAADLRSGNGSSQRYQGRISPVVGRIAAEHDVDLNEIEGTGRGGRITKRDILSYLEQRQAQRARVAVAVEEAPAVAARPDEARVRRPAQDGEREAPVAVPGEVMPLTSMRRAIAEHMVRSKQTSPHVTTVFEVNFARVAAHRQANKEAFARDGASLTYTAYIVAATVEALKAYPIVNSSWSDEGVVIKPAINIGIAVAIEDGLIVPVIKNADSLSLLGLARQVNDLAERARQKQLTPADVQGGTFSITNHGTSGSLFATPIINQPQCGILGVGKIEKRVVVIDDAIAIRPMAYIGLTFDHRILDGATADGFVSFIKERLEQWY